MPQSPQYTKGFTAGQNSMRLMIGTLRSDKLRLGVERDGLQAAINDAATQAFYNEATVRAAVGDMLADLIVAAHT